MIVLGCAGGFLLFGLSMAVGFSLLGCVAFLLVCVLFPVSVMYYVKGKHAIVKARDQKRFAAFMKEHPSESVLGCIRVGRSTGSALKPSETHELLVLTPERVFVAGVAEVISRAGEDYAFGTTTILKTEEKVIPSSEIKRVGLREFLSSRVKLSLLTPSKEYKWWTRGLIPDTKGVWEDYAGILRQAFGDKLCKDACFGRAEIGVAILIGVATLVAFLMLIYIRWLPWTIPWTFLFARGGIPSPFALCFFAGMALYISDRKSFLIRRSGEEHTAVLLAVLGFVLMAGSVIEGLSTLVWMGVGGWEGWVIGAFTLVYIGLVFLSGLLLISDPDKMVEDKSRYPPSAQRLDVETQTKYPRNLVARYADQYPHNPEGVLEWHIHRKLKEGRTREQAIKELQNA